MKKMIEGLFQEKLLTATELLHSVQRVQLLLQWRVLWPGRSCTCSMKKLLPQQLPGGMQHCLGEGKLLT